jgi:hypothetical protein
MPSRSLTIDQLLASLGKLARGSHQARLDAQSLAALERFVTYLVKVESKGENTARVYKSLCAKALAQGGPDPDNPMMMSALRALRRFWASQ